MLTACGKSIDRGDDGSGALTNAQYIDAIRQTAAYLRGESENSGAVGLSHSGQSSNLINLSATSSDWEQIEPYDTGMDRIFGLVADGMASGKIIAGNTTNMLKMEGEAEWAMPTQISASFLVKVNQNSAGSIVGSYFFSTGDSEFEFGNFTINYNKDTQSIESFEFDDIMAGITKIFAIRYNGTVLEQLQDCAANDSLFAVRYTGATANLSLIAGYDFTNSANIFPEYYAVMKPLYSSLE